jgi:hypothetical protein
LVTFLSMLSTHMKTEPFLAHLKQTPLGQLLIRITQFNHAYLKTDDQVAMAELFLRDNYRFYKQLVDMHVVMLIGELANLDIEHDIVALAKRINFRVMPEVYPVNCANVVQARAVVDAFKHAHSMKAWQCDILLTPQLSYTCFDDPIYVQEKNGNTVTLNDKSVMIHSLSDQYEHACAIYVDQELVGQKKIVDLLHQIENIRVD